MPAPSSQQVYFAFLAPGVTSQFDQAHNYWGHHSAFTFAPGWLNTPVYYAVILASDPTRPAADGLAQGLLTGSFAHRPPRADSSGASGPRIGTVSPGPRPGGGS